MAEEPRKRAVASSGAKSEQAAATEPQKEKKKKKKQRKQDHEVCAGTGTLDQIFLVFLFMTVALCGIVWYLFKVSPLSRALLFRSSAHSWYSRAPLTVATCACKRWIFDTSRTESSSSRTTRSWTDQQRNKFIVGIHVANITEFAPPRMLSEAQPYRPP
jgi:hypothetical protein